MIKKMRLIYHLMTLFFLVVECKIHCQNGGTCIAPYKCSCQRGYGGTLCEKGEFLYIDNGGRTAEDYNRRGFVCFLHFVVPPFE